MGDQPPNTRRSRRVPTLLRTVWQGRSGTHPAHISDVTMEGCHIHTRGAAEVGETITFKLPLHPDGEIDVQTEVVHHNSRLVGFGVRFLELNETQRAVLAQLVIEGEALLDESSN